jgi:hypothetical protein
MSRGASAKREREYDEPKSELECEGRYPAREDEVAARVVSIQRLEPGETKEAQRGGRGRPSAQRPLPIAGYEHLTVAEVVRQIRRLTPSEIRRVGEHERIHKNRASLLRTLDRALTRH